MDLIEQSKAMSAALAELPIDIRAELLNEIRANLHEVSPFKTEPVDFVRWVPAPKVVANDYNPNAVAPPEMDLLRVSIMADGYTQPIVTNQEDDNLVVIDGFHRNRVGKECEDVRARVHGFLPVVQIRQSQLDRGDRIASTIRHNRARGKHRVQAMSDIVIELKKRNWTDERIAKNLGMDKDEILRLCQISGLSELFSDQNFSQAWDVEGAISEEDFKELTDDITTYGEDLSNTRTVNTNDDGRIFHTYEGWECHKAGFYQGSKEGWTKKQCEEAYRDFLSDLPRFEAALEAVVTTWKNSCEHYLTNSAMNRIAWLGQAAACYAMGIPSTFRGGFYLMTEDQQNAANEMALKYLNKWLVANGRQEMTLEEAYSYDRQSDIY
jgi:ParB-like chromosome segregation protein Spo0J